MALRSVLPRCVLAALAAVVAIGVVGIPRADAAPWAPVNQATIRPGNQMVTNNSQCTSNFVFTNGSDVLLGMAAHCAAATTSVNGCENKSLPLGTPVAIQNAKRPGTLVYSSWQQMQATGETRPNPCYYNDLALVRIDPADVGSVNPTMPRWGGPTGVGTAPTKLLAKVYSYGNSGLRLGLTGLAPKRGYSLGMEGGGWEHRLYFATPGIPGDSGMGVLNANGRAIGVLSTYQRIPLALSNGVGDLSHLMGYARTHGMGGLTLALGSAFRTL